MNIQWYDDHIKVDVPKRPKKITGTRFASILGLNRWSTPFNTWCAITRTYEEPFVDTKYTLAGKAIEPKQAEYMEKMYGMEIIRPADIWGEDYFKKTYGDFFNNVPMFGGMWDYLMVDEDGNTCAVLEMKTTKRAEDWSEDVPEYYAMQAALYAYLLDLDQVIMVCSFLEEKDYENPEAFVPSVDNTITVVFNVYDRYPDFDTLINDARTWWVDHVETGISPEFDEKKDADILMVLRTNTLTPDTDIKSLVAEAETLKEHIDEVSATIAQDEKRLKTVNDLIKKYAIGQFGEGDKKVEIEGAKYKFSVSVTPGKAKSVYDDEAMKADGIYEKYVKTEISAPTYRMTVK